MGLMAALAAIALIYRKQMVFVIASEEERRMKQSTIKYLNHWCPVNI
jgi:hypothetical protein